jgi:HEAT repeat protein
MWGAALGTLIALGLFCWLFVAPYVQVRTALGRVQHDDDYKSEVERLGGHEVAAQKLSFYLRIPAGFTPNRWMAAEMLARCGPAAVQVLVRCLVDLDDRTRSAAADALSGFGREDVPGLIRAMREDRGDTRGWAAWLLGMAGRETSAAIPPLVEMLEDRVTTVKLEIIEIPIGPDTEPHRFGPSYGNRRVPLRTVAARSLGTIGPAAREAIPALEKLLNDEDYEVRQDAAEAIKKIKTAPEKKPAP